MSPDRDNEYFSDGLSEEIINALTRLPGLRVIARTSAFRFRGHQDLRRVGEALGVRNVLEGGVRRAGERLRITAQLIDVADDSHIWSERFDREMTDVFEIQDEIAGAIVEKTPCESRLHRTGGAPDDECRSIRGAARSPTQLQPVHAHSPPSGPSIVSNSRSVLARARLPGRPGDARLLPPDDGVHVRRPPRHAAKCQGRSPERALQLDPCHGEAQAATAVMAVIL